MLDNIFYAKLLYFQQFNNFLWCILCEILASEVVFELDFSLGDIRHFLSLDFFPVFDNFINFEKIFLGMRANLGSGPCQDLVFYFFPVLAVTNNC